MRFCSLGSGSAGNGTVVEAHDGSTRTRVLIDCGFSQRTLAERLGRAGLTVADLDAVFITHEHGDHLGCALALAKRHQLPIWMSRGTWRAARNPDLPGLLNLARDGETIAIGALQLRPFTVPHDAAEPLQLRCTDGARHLAILTDLGSVTDHVLDHLRGCDALVLECNHDVDLLATSRYPAALRARVGGRLGHLSNARAAQVLQASGYDGLQHLVAAHLSAENNTPAHARQALAQVCGAAPQDIVVADQHLGFDWLSVA